MNIAFPALEIHFYFIINPCSHLWSPHLRADPDVQGDGMWLPPFVTGLLQHSGMEPAGRSQGFLKLQLVVISKVNESQTYFALM